MPFLKDSWYCAGWASDLQEGPTGITITGETIALYRDSTGKAIAVADRCPHRFAPLSQGKVKGDVLECPYHGLQFNSEGACVSNPHGRGIIPPRAKIKPYVLVEQHGALWIWMGDPSRADISAIPDIPFVVDPRYAVAKGCVRIEANYQLLNDNLLDLTHAAYLHPTTVGLDPELSVGEMKLDYSFKTEGTIVKSNYIWSSVPPSAQFKRFFKHELGDLYVYVTWYPASSIVLDLSMSPLGVPKGEISHPTDDICMIPGAHLIVPETENSSFYFYALSRNIDIHDEEGTANVRAVGDYTFSQEDGPMVEACYKLMAGEEFFDLEPAILETDRAGIQARRILAQMISRQADFARSDAPSTHQPVNWISTKTSRETAT